ncbi:MAG: hypothetical protein JVY19_10430 [Ferrovum myxofaciens]|nr:hypothetical protein [Ferrovum myxofaciens]QWY74224.1 MAG: hypothetical protein JVY19_10430 [Ferrovum myxofaciens]
MRKSLILPLLEQRVRIIGQVRRDTALYLPPEPEPKRRGAETKNTGSDSMQPCWIHCQRRK